MHQNKVLTAPVVITDIPYWNSGLEPPQFRLKIPVPDTSEILDLRLQIMNDTYFNTDWEVCISVDICRKDFGLSPSKGRQTGPDMKFCMEKYMSLICPDSCDPAIFAKFVKKAKEKTLTKKLAIKKALERERENKDKNEDWDSLSQGKAKVARGKGLFNAWNKMALITRFGCRGLERHIPDSLGTVGWVDWKYCDPTRAHNYVSEWTLPWDFEDDNSTDWEDVKVSKQSLKRFQESRISLGREIGTYRLPLVNDPSITALAVPNTAGKETDSSDFPSVATPATSETTNSSIAEGSQLVLDELSGQDPRNLRMDNRSAINVSS